MEIESSNPLFNVTLFSQSSISTLDDTAHSLIFFFYKIFFLTQHGPRCSRAGYWIATYEPWLEAVVVFDLTGSVVYTPGDLTYFSNTLSLDMQAFRGRTTIR